MLPTALAESIHPAYMSLNPSVCSRTSQEGASITGNSSARKATCHYYVFTRKIFNVSRGCKKATLLPVLQNHVAKRCSVRCRHASFGRWQWESTLLSRVINAVSKPLLYFTRLVTAATYDDSNTPTAEADYCHAVFSFPHPPPPKAEYRSRLWINSSSPPISLADLTNKQQVCQNSQLQRASESTVYTC